VGRRRNMFGWTDIDEDDDANMFIVKSLEWTNERNFTYNDRTTIISF
jgi:hypothetical protein